MGIVLRHVRRRVGAASAVPLLGLALWLAGAFAAPPASAACAIEPVYPSAPCQLQVSMTAAGTCDTITASANGGFLPGSSVALTLEPGGIKLPSAATAPGGGFTVSLAIPAGTPGGAHTLTATGPGADGKPLTLSAALSIQTDCVLAETIERTTTTTIPTQVLAATQTRSSLPFTGTDALALAAAGMLSIMVGLTLRAAAARRRVDPPHS